MAQALSGADRVLGPGCGVVVVLTIFMSNPKAGSACLIVLFLSFFSYWIPVEL